VFVAFLKTNKKALPECSSSNAWQHTRSRRGLVGYSVGAKSYIIGNCAGTEKALLEDLKEHFEYIGSGK
jgi:hypothetical protein